jgi:hypothetical protein
MVQPVLTDMKPRLEAAATAVASTRDAHQLQMRVRNQLVVAAVDHGMSQRAVARAAGMTVSRVCAILVNSQGDDDE